MNEELKPAVDKIEGQEGLEITQEQGTGSPEDFREQIAQESEGEVAAFTQEGEAQLAQIEARAESAGMVIDPEAKEALQTLDVEAISAQTQLKTEIGVIDEGRYQNFAEREKAQWAEQGTNPLSAAEQGRRSAERALEQEKDSLESYKKRVETLRSDIDAKKSNIISHILNFREIQALERQLTTTERIKDSAEKFAEDKKELLVAYDRLVSEQQELGILMEEAYKENTAWDERKRVEFLEEEERRDVTNLARTHNTYFVHDIVDAEWKPSANNRALNTKNLTWNDQLDILMGLHPTISVSTVDQGSEQRTFGGKGSWGVFISGGRALGGGRGDIGSVAVGLRDRKFTSGNDAGVDAIEKAISGRDKNESYNELIVEQPEIAGVYVRWNKNMPPLAEEVSMPNRYTDSNGDTYRYDSWWESMQDVMDRNLPIFVMDMNNQAHLIHDIDAEKRSFKVAAVLTPEDIVDMPSVYKQHTGSNEERGAIGRVFDSVSHLLTDEEKAGFESSEQQL